MINRDYEREDRERKERNVASVLRERERIAEIRAQLRAAVEALGATWTANENGYSTRVNGGNIELSIDSVADKGERYSRDHAEKFKSGTFSVRLGKFKSWRRAFGSLPYAEIAEAMVAYGNHRAAAEEAYRVASEARDAVRDDSRHAKLVAQLKPRERNSAWGTIYVVQGGKVELKLFGITLDQAERAVAAFRHEHRFEVTTAEGTVVCECGHPAGGFSGDGT